MRHQIAGLQYIDIADCSARAMDLHWGSEGFGVWFGYLMRENFVFIGISGTTWACYAQVAWLERSYTFCRDGHYLGPGCKLRQRRQLLDVKTHMYNAETKKSFVAVWVLS